MPCTSTTVWRACLSGRAGDALPRRLGDLTRLVDWVCENWDQADEGIWEIRGGRRDFTYSRLMSWVAIERAVRIAFERGLPADVIRWQSTRDQIYHQIMAKGWNEHRRAFVQSYGSERPRREHPRHAAAPSSSLRPIRAGSRPSTRSARPSSRTASSIATTSRPSPDGLEGEEGTFSICTFWYVEALARAGRVDEARLAFEKMLTYANHLGLYAEQIGRTGEALGNFPQAFTHLALVSAGHYLDRRLSALRGRE